MLSESYTTSLSECVDNEDTSLTIKAFLDEAEYQTFKGLVAMKEDSYTFVIEG